MKHRIKKQKDKHLCSLRNRIILYFLLCSFLISLANGIISGAFELLVGQEDIIAAEDGQAEAAVVGEEQAVIDSVPIVVIYIVLLLAVYAAGINIFIRLTIKALNAESSRRIKEQNLMYAAIAHDLKTPMTSVLGFTKALQDGKVKPDEEKEIYDIIYRKTGSMNSLVDTLFDYAGLGTEEYKPVLERTDLCALVRDCAAENYSDLEEHGDELEIDIPETELFITADRRELKRAVTNLILNACRHNPDGTGVLIRVGEKDGSAKVIIADTGNDIPEGMNIFEPFVTDNDARTAGGGSGLGLAITKRIVDRHGGEICLLHDIEGYTKAFAMTLRL